MTWVTQRRAGDEITVGPDLRIRIVEVWRGSVRLAIDAPAELAIKNVRREGQGAPGDEADGERPRPDPGPEV